MNWPEGVTLPDTLEGEDMGASFQVGYGGTRASNLWEYTWMKEWIDTYNTDSERAAKALEELEKAFDISLTKPGSSVAHIKEKEYFLHNLFAVMLVPSGNDVAYVVADYCGGLLSPQAGSSQERVGIFMENLNLYLQQQGYSNTVLYDPSGFDMEALTTTLDLKAVVYRLLEYSWFRETVSKNTYTVTLPDGSTQMWQSTNTFLDPASEYYNENVCGVKTGSLSDDYNLIVLYKQHGKEFLICSLGSQSDSSRYDDVNFILKTIDESEESGLLP